MPVEQRRCYRYEGAVGGKLSGEGLARRTMPMQFVKVHFIILEFIRAARPLATVVLIHLRSYSPMRHPLLGL